eukprot:92068-Prymnesium_polylepis.1
MRQQRLELPNTASSVPPPPPRRPCLFACCADVGELEVVDPYVEGTAEELERAARSKRLGSPSVRSRSDTAATSASGLEVCERPAVVRHPRGVATSACIADGCVAEPLALTRPPHAVLQEEAIGGNRSLLAMGA